MHRGKRLRIILAAVAAAIGTIGCQTRGFETQQVDLAIDNVTVIDPKTRRVLPNHSVYISDKTIVAVRPTRAKSSFKGRVVINGTDRYLIPGLMDMHVHLFLPESVTSSLNLLLAKRRDWNPRDVQRLLVNRGRD